MYQEQYPMSKKPIFLFSFANDRSKSLRLEEEERQLRNILQAAHDQEQIEFISLGNTSLDDIYRSYNRFHNRIALFHYSGHSDESLLYLADKGARAENLAKVIGIQKSLALVFLNGCSNRQQVEELFTNGVKVVIATSAPIEDNKALIFSKMFYQALVGGKNIKESFDTAAARIKEEDGNLEINYRAIIRREPIEAAELEWGLYTIEDKYLDWILPSPVKEEQVATNFTNEVELIATDLINKEIVRLGFEGLTKYKEEYRTKWKMYQASPNPILFNELQDYLLKSYPTSLSIQLRDLFNPLVRTNGRLRLVEINEAYLTLLKLLVSICLADLWRARLNPETLKPNEDFFLRPEYKKDLSDFFDLSALGTDNFDYGWLLATIRRIFDDNNITPFIEESSILLDCFVNYDENYQAYRFLEQELRSRLVAQNIDQSEVEDLCFESEKQLGILLRTCGFLSDFQLVTVKDIGVRLPNRVKEPQFVHKSAILRGDNYRIQEDMDVPRTSFTNNNSVLITKDIFGVHDSLNLSPFVIDENAYKLKKEKTPKVYFFKGWGDENTIHYELAQTLKEFFVIDKNIDVRKYTKGLANIRNQLLWFRDDLGFSVK